MRILAALLAALALIAVAMAGLSRAAEEAGGDAVKAGQSSERPRPHPFAGGAPAQPSGGDAASPWTRFMTWVQATQHALHRELAQAVRAVRQEAFSASLTLALLSFLYGVLHAVGPGHGKAVISSYVFASKATMRRGIALSLVASLVQALSAVALVGVLALALNAAGVEMRETVGQLETASYALIAAIGVWLVATELRRRWPKRAASHAHDHDGGCSSCGHHHNHIPEARHLDEGWSGRRAAAIVMAVGIRPCSGAILVLVFALTHGLFWAGVGATFAMALGTAITVSALAALAVGSRETAVSLAGGVWAERIHGAAALGGSLVVLALGVVLFIASLGPARPF